MVRSKKRKTEGTEAKADSSEMSEGLSSDSCCTSASSVSSEEEIIYEVADLSRSNYEDVGMIMDQSRIFPPSEAFFSILDNSKVLISGDLILAFCGFLPLSKALGMFPKKLKKAINSLLGAAGKSCVSKDEVHVFYPERATNLPLEMVLDMYKKLSFGGFKHIVFVSKIKACGKLEARDLVEDFKEYNPLDLSYRPVRGEEILLLSSYIAKKHVEVNSTMLRLLLVSTQMFGSFVGLLEREISGG